MECKFLNHGLAIAYQETVRPCCDWQFDNNYKSANQLNQVNLVTWHQNNHIQEAKNLLQQNIWPKNCGRCEKQESQERPSQEAEPLFIEDIVEVSALSAEALSQVATPTEVAILTPSSILQQAYRVHTPLKPHVAELDNSLAQSNWSVYNAKLLL